MRKVIGVSALIATTLVSGQAFAGNFQATCDGWTDTGQWEIEFPAEVVATATLERFDGTNWVYVGTSVDTASLQPFDPIDMGALWGTTLNGTYRTSLAWIATVTVSENNTQVWPFYGDAGPFTCTPPQPNNPARTPGYWKNHAASWPVTSLAIGGTSYSQACLLDALRLPARGDARMKLLHHLIATELNLLPGTVTGVGNTDPYVITNVPSQNDTIISTVNAAHAFLGGNAIDCSGPSLNGSKPTGSARGTANDLKDALDAYNNNAL